MSSDENLSAIADQIPKPSTYKSGFWIQALNQTTENNKSGKNVGKWMIFRPRNTIDAVWEKIKEAVKIGSLGMGAKVSTRKDKSEQYGDSHVICIYTYDHEDESDVMRVREKLRELGFAENLGYKTDAATYSGVYRATGHSNVCKYRA